MLNFRDYLIEDEERLPSILKAMRSVAVLGIKTEAQANQPAHYVPKYLVEAGLQVVPVPVYYPDAAEILGQKVYRSLAEIPFDIDWVDVFRKPQDIAGHVEDILAKKPKGVWFQLGIRNDAVAERLAKAGIQVVQDRCLMVDHRRFA
jgi:predicted CoA-binding protein